MTSLVTASTASQEQDRLRYGYARVSKGEEDLRNLQTQIKALTDAGIRSNLIYTDEHTGSSIKRPGWIDLMEVAGPGDIIHVQYLDRFSRNLLTSLTLIQELATRNIHIISIAEGINTADNTPTALAHRQLILVFAEWQYNNTRERIINGQERARQEGRPIGRPEVLAPAIKEAIWQHHLKNDGPTKIKNLIELQYNVSVSLGTIRNTIRKYQTRTSAPELALAPA